MENLFKNNFEQITKYIINYNKNYLVVYQYNF